MIGSERAKKKTAPLAALPVFTHRERTPPPHNAPARALLTRVAVERAVRRGVAHQRHHRLAHAVQRPGGAPRRLEDVEADLPRLMVLVLMLMMLLWLCLCACVLLSFGMGGVD